MARLAITHRSCSSRASCLMYGARLTNDNDISAIRRAVAYLDKLSFESIPILPVGSCFVAGLATDLPIKVDVELLPEKQRPDSETINLEKQWSS